MSKKPEKEPEKIGDARVHSGGKINVPKKVRELIDVEDGDIVVFHKLHENVLMFSKARLAISKGVYEVKEKFSSYETNKSKKK